MPRLKIAAVAATAAFFRNVVGYVNAPPQDCRSRGDCGHGTAAISDRMKNRLKIAAVAATAASGMEQQFIANRDRLKIAAVAATAAAKFSTLCLVF